MRQNKWKKDYKITYKSIFNHKIHNDGMSSLIAIYN